MKEILKLFIASFIGKNSYFHIAAIFITYCCSVFGIDWKYFLFIRDHAPQTMLVSANMIGFILPITVPSIFFVIGTIKRNNNYIKISWTTTKTILAAFLISLFYKSITGRTSPPLHGEMTDTSNLYNFGFLEHSVFGGWPSSHTTVMFALAACIFVLFPKSKIVRGIAYIIAFYIGFGVAIGYHWLSEFIAGILIGTAVGITIAKKHR